MLTVRQPEALSVDWVAQFDQQTLRADARSSHSDVEPALRLSGDVSGGSSVRRASRDGRVVLFDGVLYERQELERTLGLTGAGSSDAALVLQAFARWGEDFLHHIHGLFAVV